MSWEHGKQSYLCVPKARRSRYFYSSIVPLLYLARNGCSPFDAHLGPGPDITDGPPGHILVRGLNKVTYDLLELTQVVGLDSPDLLVTDSPEEVVTWGLVRAMRQPCDLRVARDHSRPELLLDPLDREITGLAQLQLWGMIEE